MTDLFYNIFGKMKRQGPGSEETTKRAFSSLMLNNRSTNIADIGCGKGGQTLTLAELTDGEIIAIDNYQPFIDHLDGVTRNTGLEHKIKPSVGDMFNLNLDLNYFDIIWSEGAAYIMGFEKALTEWNKFLKPGGFMAVSDINKFIDILPPAVDEFFRGECGGVLSITENINIIEKCGYKLLDHFRIPETDWLDEFYYPMEKILDETVPINSEEEETIKAFRNEIEIYKNYKDYFGYTFYIIQMSRDNA